MSDGPSAAVWRHLALVYAILTSYVLAAAASCAAAVALVPWTPPYTYIVIAVSLVGLLVGVFAYACTPRERSAKRYWCFMGICAAVGALLTFVVQELLAGDLLMLMMALLLTAAIFVSFSVAAIIMPQKMMYFFLLALAIVIAALVVLNLVLSIYTTFFYSETAELVCMYATLAAFSLYVAVETEVIIIRASEGDQDPVDDAASLFRDIINVFLWVTECVSRPKRDRSERQPLVSEGSVA